MKKLKVIVPASTSNLGPGFDTLGLAMTLYNELVLESTNRKLAVEFESGVEGVYLQQMRRMVRRTVKVFEEASGQKIEGVRLIFRNEVPIARGLGSSATFRMGALTALNAWAGETLSHESLLNIGCRMERHTENCVAGTVGGLTASGFIGGGVIYARYPVSERFCFVAAVPDRPMSTSATRKILPRRINFRDAVYNLNRTALLLDALGSGDVSCLWELLRDRLHQPYRARILTPLHDVLDAAKDAGAVGGFLSGSGSTIMAMVTGRAEEVAMAMQKTLAERQWKAEVYILETDKSGIRVIFE